MSRVENWSSTGAREKRATSSSVEPRLLSKVPGEDTPTHPYVLASVALGIKCLRRSCAPSMQNPGCGTDFSITLLYPSLPLSWFNRIRTRKTTEKNRESSSRQNPLQTETTSQSPTHAQNENRNQDFLVPVLDSTRAHALPDRWSRGRGIWGRRLVCSRKKQSRPQSPRPLDQRSGSAWALVESKTGTRKSWFRFDSARASEIVVEMNKFQPPMRIGRFLAGFQSGPEVSIPGAVQKDRGLWGRD